MKGATWIVKGAARGNLIWRRPGRGSGTDYAEEAVLVIAFQVQMGQEQMFIDIARDKFRPFVASVEERFDGVHRLFDTLWQSFAGVRCRCPIPGPGQQGLVVAICKRRHGKGHAALRVFLEIVLHLAGHGAGVCTQRRNVDVVRKRRSELERILAAGQQQLFQNGWPVLCADNVEETLGAPARNRLCVDPQACHRSIFQTRGIVDFLLACSAHPARGG